MPVLAPAVEHKHTHTHLALYLNVEVFVRYLEITLRAVVGQKSRQMFTSGTDSPPV